MPTYVFDYFQVDGAPVYSNPLTLAMDADHTVVAVYKLQTVPPVTHTLTLQSTPVDVQVSIDGVSQGNTPVQVTVEEGTYQISVPPEVTI